MASYIAYYRVSTGRQGQSGLGLDAQRQSVSTFMETMNGSLIGEYVEVESGNKKERPELTRALSQCRKNKAILVIAKLDRLARNVHFISGLMEADIEFVAVDNPHANRLMLHMLAAFAEHEREQISQRTKAALAAARKRGVILGKTGVERAEENRKRADTFVASISNILKSLQEEGYRSVRALSDQLNARKVPTAKGGRWHPVTVHRALKRLDGQNFDWKENLK